jgi:hypothetical protein
MLFRARRSLSFALAIIFQLKIHFFHSSYEIVVGTPPASDEGSRN